MRLRLIDRWLAHQFARPSGWIGQWLFGPWLDRISAPMQRLALEALDPQPGERVLEVGFGGGGMLAALIRAGAVPVGAEVSEAMVARARRRFSHIELHHASVERLPLPDRSIDKAVSLNSLYFWPDPEAAFRELARVLRPRGRLVLGFEPPEELAKWPGSRFGFRAFPLDGLEVTLNAAGFHSLACSEGHGRKPDRFLILSAARHGANG